MEIKYIVLIEYKLINLYRNHLIVFFVYYSVNLDNCKGWHIV